MNQAQLILFALLSGLFLMLLWGRVRYDLVAFGALIVALLTGVVPQDEAFSGFGHPATVIIALVLIVSRGLANSGAIELLAQYVIGTTRGLQTHIGIMSAVGALLSGIMNNVAALALLMPVDMEAASRAKRSPSLTLMPLSFATILGGMVTLIGTPPNIVVATFREKSLGEPFGMFDFSPVGIVVAVVGILFVTLVGWRLLPEKRTQLNVRDELQNLDGYIAELQVPEKSDLVDQRLRDLYTRADENDVAILGLIRNGRRLPGSARNEKLRVKDLLIIEGGVEAMDTFIGVMGLKHSGEERHGGLVSETLTLIEAVVPVGAKIEKRSALEMRLAYRQGVTLLGVSRQGRPFRARVRKLRIRAGDILLLLGPEERMQEVVDWLGCLPLADRGLRLMQRHKSWAAMSVFAAAILLASLGIFYLPVVLAMTAVVYVLYGLVPLSQLYKCVEWPVILLLGSLIPIGTALETTGGTDLIAGLIIDLTERLTKGLPEGLPVLAVLALLMTVTMTLSDILNNVATTLIAAPIAIRLANHFDASADPFLMAVAIAASCAFLTPIGHKNNTIIMGPGGYRFGDYWRIGLPLEILVVVVSLPMILYVWPLYA
ncbi:MAG: anion permease [Planctomycetes bacterium]|nr:anion permease [Planctomycetota bacterium]